MREASKKQRAARFELRGASSEKEGSKRRVFGGQCEEA
jgi:hypothetical protein